MYIDGLDMTDNKILEIIKDNARSSFSEIGEQTGISRVSVKNRMEKLENNGIIQGYKIVIDPTKVPEGILFFLDIEVTPAFYEDLVEYLASEKMIRQIYAVAGECRIHAIGYALNKRNLEHFANTMYRSGQGVRKLSCHTVLSTLLDRDGGVEYVPYQGKEQLEEEKTKENLHR